MHMWAPNSLNTASKNLHMLSTQQKKQDNNKPSHQLHRLHAREPFQHLHVLREL